MLSPPCALRLPRVCLRRFSLINPSSAPAARLHRRSRLNCVRQERRRCRPHDLQNLGSRERFFYANPLFYSQRYSTCSAIRHAEIATVALNRFVLRESLSINSPLWSINCARWLHSQTAFRADGENSHSGERICRSSLISL